MNLSILGKVSLGEAVTMVLCWSGERAATRAILRVRQKTRAPRHSRPLRKVTRTLSAIKAAAPRVLIHVEILQPHAR